MEARTGPVSDIRPPPVGVVGASARAAAHSLVRAGYAPWAVDLFADRDLRLVAPCARCPLADYPAALPSLADQFPPGPVLYTGGLENHPEVVAELGRRRELWGVGPDGLERVRDPFALFDLLAGKGFAAPQVRRPDEPDPSQGRWLLKPARSAGGFGIRPAPPGPHPADLYLQEFVDGPPMSAAFAAAHPRCELLGVFEQLVGEPWLHARPFAYCGNITANPDDNLRGTLVLIGYRLLTAGGLRGVCGVDFVHADGSPFVVEVNPRYTAAMELLEHATGRAVFPSPTPPPNPLPHRERGSRTAAGSGLPPSPLVGEGAGGRGVRACAGKAVYYAPHPITFPPAGPWDADLELPFDPWRLPGYADIPDPGEVIEPGQPVLTFFATGSTTADCREKLKERAAELDARFGGPAGYR
ncbi:MAG: ATP-grasp domain-containing protein [Gemmataceae bacterium]|nr:ATP-grasp domain-containing protein [Gemmataceae bacterium]